MNIDCIIIDDEPLALDILEDHVAKVNYLNLVGRFESAIEATNQYSELKAQLIYLDINMPDLSGIDFLKSMVNPPNVIFTTAHESYALQGFELDAVDYLLKPISFHRFLKATGKARERVTTTNHAAGQAGGNGVSDYIFVKSEHNVIKIRIADILYVQAYKDYIKIFKEGERPILTIKSLKSVYELLKPHGFVRTHRSYVVAIDKIESFRNGRVRIGETVIPIGDNYREEFHHNVIDGRI